MVNVLGVSCSLRNARFGSGSKKLINEINSINNKDDLLGYLEQQTKIRADDFFKAGRSEKLPFDKIYRNLLRSKGDRGLSNSEAALVCGLWGAGEAGANIRHCGLASFFPMNGEARDLEKLREIVLWADAVLVSGPVYFGDRGSLAQAFFEFLKVDDACRKHVNGRVYAGVAVGAKRNGGQETTLIYQLIDATNMNMLAVGNDSATTAQYGGTSHAGDVGTMAADDYGIKTSVGTGRRLAMASQMWDRGAKKSLVDNTRVAVWLLQDTKENRGRTLIEDFCAAVEKQTEGVEFRVSDFTQEEIYRCIACDVCPTDVGTAEEYRCIINSSDDLFKRCHQEIIQVDAILVAAYSPVDRRGINSVYQRFVERTRYLRRDDYLLGDRLIAPLVISEVNSNQNLHIRMLTSFLRHLSVLHHPLIGFEYNGEVLNWGNMIEQGISFAGSATRLTAGRLSTPEQEVDERHYNPVGYIISAEKSEHDQSVGKTEQIQGLRRDVHKSTKEKRIA